IFAELLAVPQAAQDSPPAASPALAAGTGQDETEAGQEAVPSPAELLELLELRPAPRADAVDARPALVVAAVLGLFPMNNQGVLRDTQAMLAGEALDGPVASFIKAGVSLDQPANVSYDHEAWSGQKGPRTFAAERAVSA